MNVFNFIKSRSIVAVVSSVIISFGFVAFAVNGATTISTNISTGGTLSVTGLSTLLGGATTTTLTLLNGEVISNATDGVIQLGGIASTTSITLLNGETITNATDGTIALTGAMTVSGASTLTGLATHGGNVVSDTDSTDSLGITGTRWASIFSDNFTGNTITLDGATGINILTITDNLADALSIVDSSGDLIAFDTQTGAEKITITPELTTVNGYVSQASSTVVGNFTVTGTFSPTQTAATTFAVGGGYGDTGSTLSADGNIQADGTLTIDGASTLTGLTSMIQASSTRLSVFDTAYFGGTATSTFDSSGNLTIVNDVVLSSGKITVDTVTDETSYVKRNLTGATSAVMEIEATHTGDTGSALLIDHDGTGNAIGLEITHDGDLAALNISAGAIRTGNVINIPMANQLAETAIDISGAVTGTSGEGIIHVDATGVLAGNAIRVDSTGANATTGQLFYGLSTGQQAAATNGIVGYFEDTGTAQATSYTVYITSTNNEALYVDTGEVLFDERLTIASGGLTITAGDLVRTGQQSVLSLVGAKAGTTAGWVVNAGDNISLATLPASQTGSTMVVPVTIPLKVGETITAFSVIGQIESGGNTVTLDADLRKHTAAAADVADASVGAIVQVSETADAIVSTAKSGLSEVVAADETFYVLLTGTTGASTDIAIQGITITVTEK